MKKETFLFLGDSITDADHLFTDHNLGTGYVNMIQEEFPKTKVINKGYDGYTLRRVLQNSEKYCRMFKPDIVTLLIGINDLGVAIDSPSVKNHPLFSPSCFKDDLETFIKETSNLFTFLNQKEYKIILMEPFIFGWPEKYKNWMEPLIDYRLAMKEIASKYNLNFIPLWDVFQKEQETIDVKELTIDGIHPTIKGHEIIAKSWIEEVNQF